MRLILEHRLSSLMAGRITTVITALLHSGRSDGALITLALIVACEKSCHTYGISFKTSDGEVKCPVQCLAQSVQSKAYM